MMRIRVSAGGVAAEPGWGARANNLMIVTIAGSAIGSSI
jgi:hypothetical protein